MKKKAWKVLIKSLKDCEFHDWLDILPTGHTIKAVPLVIIPKEWEPPKGYALRWSTIFYIEGYHYPKGMKIEALVVDKST